MEIEGFDDFWKQAKAPENAALNAMGNAAVIEMQGNVFGGQVLIGGKIQILGGGDVEMRSFRIEFFVAPQDEGLTQILHVSVGRPLVVIDQGGGRAELDQALDLYLGIESRIAGSSFAKKNRTSGGYRKCGALEWTFQISFFYENNYERYVKGKSGEVI